MSFDDGVKERIREAIDIVELVSQYVPLQRSGRNFVGRCPWHDDSKPSLQVNPVRQSYKCWVCDIGGDAFAFIMKVENVGFREAMEILADKVGIALPKRKEKKIFLPPTGQASGDPNDELAQLGQEDNETVSAPRQREISRQDLFKATEWLAKIYHEALLTLGEAEAARKYLEERGIDQKDIEKFQIGYAPALRDWLVEKVKRNPTRLQILELVGNLVNRETEEGIKSNEYYDRFRGRVLFPIRDTQNRTVAFGGRVLPGSTSPAKYVNSPETPLFSKHRVLYGLDSARHTMKETKRALVMEGYTDVITAHRFGFGEAVAALGTAVGPEHVRILRRYVDKMILVLDGDAAGQKRTGEVLEYFVAQGADMSVLTLPAGMDPAEFLEQHGTEGFRTLLETETVDALEFAFRNVTRGVDLEHDIIASSKALDALLDVIAKAPGKGLTPDDPIRIRIDKMIQNLSRRFLVTDQQIRQRLHDKRRRLEIKPQYASEYQDDVYEAEEPVSELWSSPEFRPDALEREMLELWLADPTAMYEFWESVPVERCRSPITRMIYAKCNELIDRGKPATFDHLIVAFDDPMMKSFLVGLDESGRKKREDRSAPLVGDGTSEPSGDVYYDDVSDLQESLRSETEEDQPLSEEIRKRLVREILDGFDRRDETRDRLKTSNEIRDSLTDEERIAKLLEAQEKLRKLQEEKRRKLGN